MSDFQHSLRQALDPASSDPVAYRTRFAMRALIGLGLVVTTLRFTEIMASSETIADVVVVVVLVCMALEYALRIYAAPALSGAIPGRPGRARFDYVRSGAGLIDLVVFAPMVVAIVQGASIETANALGALWVLKLARYSTNLALLKDVVWDARGQLTSVLLLFGVILLLTATRRTPAGGQRAAR